MSAPIACEGLSCGYPGRTVLEGITFEANPGSITALLGPNGSGKSTLLRTITGELPSSQGSIKIQNQPTNQLTARDRARIVAFVPPEERTDFPFLVREIVAMGRIPHSEGLFDTDEDRKIVAESMARAECESLADRPIMNISAGERQRALLARALAQQAPILLMDEPTSHLDPGHLVSFARLVRSLAESGLTILLALHDLNLASHIADRSLLLHNGRVSQSGSTRDVLSSLELDEAYGTTFERAAGSDGSIRLSPRYGESVMS